MYRYQSTYTKQLAHYQSLPLNPNEVIEKKNNIFSCVCLLNLNKRKPKCSDQAANYGFKPVLDLANLIDGQPSNRKLTRSKFEDYKRKLFTFHLIPAGCLTNNLELFFYLRTRNSSSTLARFVFVRGQPWFVLSRYRLN